jgi:hypothetical protein
MPVESMLVTQNCKSPSPLLNEPIFNRERMLWIEVKKLDHYFLTMSQISRASTEPGGAPRC